MSDEPNTASMQQAPETDAPVRSTKGVLLALGLIVLVPIVVLIIMLVPWVGAGGAGQDLVDSIDTDQVQAVYLTNDLVYFGMVGDASGDFFELNDAFYLRATDVAGKDSGKQLVPVPVSQEVGGDGDLRINANEVVRVQALKQDSDIAKVIDTAS